MPGTNSSFPFPRASTRINDLIRRVTQLEAELVIAKRELAELEARSTRSADLLRDVGGARG